MEKSVLASVLSLIALAPTLAQAADGRVDFTGELVAQTCVINGGTNNFTVALPKVSTTTFANGIKSAGSTVVKFSLTSCVAGSARVFFELGPNVNPTTGRLKNTVTTGGAANVEIGLSRNSQYSEPISIGAASGTQNTLPVTFVKGAADLKYFAQYVIDSKVVPTPGKVVSNVTYSIEYM